MQLRVADVVVRLPGGFAPAAWSLVPINSGSDTQHNSLHLVTSRDGLHLLSLQVCACCVACLVLSYAPVQRSHSFH